MVINTFAVSYFRIAYDLTDRAGKPGSWNAWKPGGQEAWRLGGLAAIVDLMLPSFPAFQPPGFQ
jgi:hypothetical protein